MGWKYLLHPVEKVPSGLQSEAMCVVRGRKGTVYDEVFDS